MIPGVFIIGNSCFKKTSLIYGLLEGTRLFELDGAFSIRITGMYQLISTFLNNLLIKKIILNGVQVI